MEVFVKFGSAQYALFLSVLLIARSVDFLSTWIATPRLVLEANPIARRLGWRWGALVNGIVCVALAGWPFAAITVATTSLMVAARNLQSAWLMRTLGEDDYCDWYLQQIRRTPLGLYLFCLLGQVGLIGAVGAVLILCHGGSEVVLAIGVGIVAYASAILFYTLLTFRRIRRVPQMSS